MNKNKMTLKSKFLEKVDMYDMIIANFIAGNSIVESEEKLDKSHIDIGFSSIASAECINKYFVISKFPDWVDLKFMSKLRNYCLRPGVKINFYTYGSPHTINWNSAEMVSKVNIWERYAKENEVESTAFNYRQKRDSIIARDRIIESTKYLNESELDHGRKLFKVSFLIEVSCLRDDVSLGFMNTSLKLIKEKLDTEKIEFKELRVNLIDWLQSLSMFSLRNIKEVRSRLSKKILTDDILANINSYKQGRIGYEGIPIGMDIYSKLAVLKKFKRDPDEAENYLVGGGTGSGKSYFMKSLLAWFIADGFPCTIMDYEGDEYSNFGAYVRASNPDDVRIVSMGKKSTMYFEPMEIQFLTGESDIDDDLKETAINYTLSMFRLIVAGNEGIMDKWQNSVLSTAIRRVYESHRVTDDKKTWVLSKGLTVRMVFDEICGVIDSQEFVDETLDSIKHKAAMEIKEACVPYFVEGESKAGTFTNPMSLNELCNANLIIFSFGMRGAASDQIDPVILGLKQLSVANISTQFSNYCKYVRHCFNVKVWEEYQRWGDAKGSAEIIGNAMTGGRKRGDVNFILTNDLASMLDENNPVNSKIAQNITGYMIGKVSSRDVRKKFCVKYELMELFEPLTNIAKAGKKKTVVKNNNLIIDKYKFAFCVSTNEGKSIVKTVLPESLAESNLFKTGVIL